MTTTEMKLALLFIANARAIDYDYDAQRMVAALQKAARDSIDKVNALEVEAN